MKRIAAVGVAVLAVAGTACSPTDIHSYVYGHGAGFHVDATAGADDGLGSGFTAAVVCSGLTGWRYGNPANTDAKANWYNGRWFSEVLCPSGHVVVGTNIFRWR